MIVGSAAAALLAGFLPWWTVQFDLTPGPYSTNGWSAGFTAWAGVLFLAAAGVIVLVCRAPLISPLRRDPPLVMVIGAAAVGLLFVIIRWLSLPKSNLGAFFWTRYGLYLALIAGIIEVTASLIELRTSAEPSSRRPRNAGALR